MAFMPHPRNFNTAPKPPNTSTPVAKNPLNPSALATADQGEQEAEKPAQFLVHQASASGGGGYGFSGAQSPLAKSLVSRPGPSVTAQLAARIKKGK